MLSSCGPWLLEYVFLLKINIRWMLQILAWKGNQLKHVIVIYGLIDVQNGKKSAYAITEAQN